MAKRMIALFLIVLMSHEGWAVRAVARTGKMVAGRKPASANACAGAECDCVALKDLVARCSMKKEERDEKTTRELFFAISLLTKDAKTGHLRADLRTCPQVAAAEVCRSRMKRAMSVYRPHQSPYKVSASRGLSNFSFELMDSVSTQPRSPASAK